MNATMFEGFDAQASAGPRRTSVDAVEIEGYHKGSRRFRRLNWLVLANEHFSR